ncbi:MAG: hypothetical protein CSA03_03075 [Bacteroidetes bacterium]|nr:MAG: hypothetical protein CSA03_03075 [Bacteroidota bacterium]
MKKRLRIFAGPNGSGKSSIIRSIFDKDLGDGVKIDFGIYINADDIAKCILSKAIDFFSFHTTITEDEFLDYASSSGLLNSEFTSKRLKQCILFEENQMSIDQAHAAKKNDNAYERIAQIIAYVLREKLLLEGKKISFETVFSHKGKIDFIRKAQENGYKVYLYFVSTASPEINVYRVKTVRVGKNGHDVPKQKIIDRYYRSMDHLYEAAQYCYQTYFFDNSYEDVKHNLFAHFKVNAEGEKKWNIPNRDFVPNWFIKYYSEKAKG